VYTKFDSSRVMATTQSGRTYQLRGAPGYNADAQYVWERWGNENGVRKSSDVTGAVYGEPKSISQIRRGPISLRLPTCYSIHRCVSKQFGEDVALLAVSVTSILCIRIIR
jgi:hypothetical protein